MAKKTFKPKAKKRNNKKRLKEELEKLVKEYVSIRDNNTCQKCNKMVFGTNNHKSHVIPVSRGQKLAYDPINIKVLCYHCHINWWHKHPLEASQWFAEKFPERHQYLMDNQGIKKWSEFELEEEIEKIKEAIIELYRSTGRTYKA